MISYLLTWPDRAYSINKNLETEGEQNIIRHPQLLSLEACDDVCKNMFTVIAVLDLVLPLKDCFTISWNIHRVLIGT